jgi:hypothetical protein
VELIKHGNVRFQVIAENSFYLFVTGFPGDQTMAIEYPVGIRVHDESRDARGIE